MASAFLFVLLCSVLAVSQARNTLTPSLDEKTTHANQIIEILHVNGCQGSSKPRRDTHRCTLDGQTRLTIRGRQFRDHGAIVTLQSAQDTIIGEKRVKFSVTCESPHSSAILPSQIVFCTLPTRSTVESDVPELATLTGVMWFDLRVAYRDRAGILRRSVQFQFGDELNHIGDHPTEVDALDALRRNDWELLQIGGLGQPLQELFRRAFATRTAASAAIANSIGIPHVKGIILHGPPGTGKTLIARTVAKLLDAKNVQIVNGPEIMSKFVGDSEKNLRQLFSPAAEDARRNGQASALHVIILDEVDAILRPRGEGDDTAARAVYDGVTTQMLAYMDGIHARSNVLIIGLTNRLEAIDKALLRPGRFEVQVRIPLPDEEGRRQIFSVHTKSLKARRYLCSKVDFQKLSAETSSFSGADIAGVVRSAVSFALERFNRDTSSSESSKNSHSNECSSARDEHDAYCERPSPSFLVVEDDLLNGIKEVLSAKGVSANLALHYKHGVVPYSREFNASLRQLLNLSNMLRTSTTIRRLTVSLYGPPGSGTTALAALVARHSHAAYSQIISVDAIGGLTVSDKVRRLEQAFETTTHVPFSFVVIDKVEEVLEMTMGRRPVDRLATELMQLIQRDDHKAGNAVSHESKRFVLMVTSKKELATNFGSVPFDAKISIGEVASEGIQQILCAYKIARDRETAKRLTHLMAPTLPLKRLIFLVHVAMTLNKIELNLPLGDLSEARILDALFTEVDVNDYCSNPPSDTDTNFADAFQQTLKTFGHFTAKPNLAREKSSLFWL